MNHFFSFTKQVSFIHMILSSTCPVGTSCLLAYLVAEWVRFHSLVLIWIQAPTAETPFLLSAPTYEGFGPFWSPFLIIIFNMVSLSSTSMCIFVISVLLFSLSWSVYIFMLFLWNLTMMSWIIFWIQKCFHTWIL